MNTEELREHTTAHAPGRDWFAIAETSDGNQSKIAQRIAELTIRAQERSRDNEPFQIAEQLTHEAIDALGEPDKDLLHTACLAIPELTPQMNAYVSLRKALSACLATPESIHEYVAQIYPLTGHLNAQQTQLFRQARIRLDQGMPDAALQALRSLFISLSPIDAFQQAMRTTGIVDDTICEDVDIVLNYITLRRHLQALEDTLAHASLNNEDSRALRALFLSNFLGKGMSAGVIDDLIHGRYDAHDPHIAGNLVESYTRVETEPKRKGGLSRKKKALLLVSVMSLAAAGLYALSNDEAAIEAQREQIRQEYRSKFGQTEDMPIPSTSRFASSNALIGHTLHSGVENGGMDISIPIWEATYADATERSPYIKETTFSVFDPNTNSWVRKFYDDVEIGTANTPGTHSLSSIAPIAGPSMTIPMGYGGTDVALSGDGQIRRGRDGTLTAIFPDGSPDAVGLRYNIVAGDQGLAPPENAEYSSESLMPPRGGSIPSDIDDMLNNIWMEGSTTFERVVLIHQFVQDTFSYTLDPAILHHYAEGTGRGELFLRATSLRSGDCDTVNTVGIALLREIGVAARLVTGFYSSPENGETTDSLNSLERHAWAEVYLPEEEVWIVVDFTPHVRDADPYTKDALRRMADEGNLSGWSGERELAGGGIDTLGQAVGDERQGLGDDEKRTDPSGSTPGESSNGKESLLSEIADAIPSNTEELKDAVESLKSGTMTSSQAAGATLLSLLTGAMLVGAAKLAQHIRRRNRYAVERETTLLALNAGKALDEVLPRQSGTRDMRAFVHHLLHARFESYRELILEPLISKVTLGLHDRYTLRSEMPDMAEANTIGYHPRDTDSPPPSLSQQLRDACTDAGFQDATVSRSMLQTNWQEHKPDVHGLNEAVIDLLLAQGIECREVFISHIDYQSIANHHADTKAFLDTIIRLWYKALRIPKKVSLVQFGRYVAPALHTCIGFHEAHMAYVAQMQRAVEPLPQIQQDTPE